MGSHLHQVPYYTGLAPRVHPTNGTTTAAATAPKKSSPDKASHSQRGIARHPSPSSPPLSSSPSSSSLASPSPPSSLGSYSPLADPLTRALYQPQNHQQQQQQQQRSSSCAHITLTHTPASPFTTASTTLTTTTTLINRQVPIAPITKGSPPPFVPYNNTPFPFFMGPPPPPPPPPPPQRPSSPLSSTSSSSSPMVMSPSSAVHAAYDPRYSPNNNNTPTTRVQSPFPMAHGRPASPFMSRGGGPQQPQQHQPQPASPIDHHPLLPPLPPLHQLQSVRRPSPIMTEEDRMLQSIKEKFLAYAQPPSVVHVK